MMKQSEVLHISLAYRYANPAWSEETNRRVYGHDSSMKGLGGNFIVTVEAETQGPWNKEILAPLKAQFDHKCLFEDLPQFRERSSTLENLTLFIAEKLQQISLLEGRWTCVAVRESRDLAAVWNFSDKKLSLQFRQLFPMQWKSGGGWGGGEWEAQVLLCEKVNSETGLMYSREEVKNVIRSLCQRQSGQVHSIEGDITPLVNKVGRDLAKIAGFQSVEISVNRHQSFRLY